MTYKPTQKWLKINRTPILVMLLLALAFGSMIAYDFATDNFDYDTRWFNGGNQ